MAEETGLDLYARTARRQSALVLRDYSTSFGLASRLLAPAARWQIGAIYGVVRLADEVVDGPADAAGVPVAERRAMLDALEVEVEAAIGRRYSTNMLVHAFQDEVVLVVRLDDRVHAHRVYPGGQTPHVQVVDAGDALDPG